MSLDFVNLVAIISAVISVVITLKVSKEILSDRKQRKQVSNKDDEIIEDAEYKKIKASTCWLEHERQRNKGDHFDDENVYLSRAEAIRENTDFFSFVNN